MTDAGTKSASTDEAQGAAPAQCTVRDTQRVALLVLPEFSHLGLSFVVEIMALANWLSQRPLYQWRIVSADGRPVRATNGMCVPTEPVLAACGRLSAIFVIASFDPKTHAKNRLLRTWLQRESRAGAQIIGVETGTELLAAAGLLDGHRAALHWDNLEGFREVYPKIRPAAEPYTLDTRVATCAGAVAIVDLMLAWVGRSHGGALAQELAQHLLHPAACGSAHSPLGRSNPKLAASGQRIAAAIRIMRDNVSSPIPLECLAARVGLSRRQFERQFKEQTGVSPHRYYVRIRVATAHRLLQQTDLSVSQIAVASGFDCLEHFSRMYKSRFGCAPSRDRRQSWEAPVMRQTRAPCDGGAANF